MVIKNLFYIVVLFILFVACKKDCKVEEIDSAIFVSAEISESNIVISGETEKIFSCLGHQIIYCEKTRKNELFVAFKKIKFPEACLTALGPATCSINLGKLESGEYDITFELDNKKTKGKLIIGAAVDLTLDSGSNVKPK